MSVKEWHLEKLGKKAVEALLKNNISAEYVENKEKAVERLLDLIPVHGTIGFGGSVTLGQLGIMDKLTARGNELLNHRLPGLTPEQRVEIGQKQQICDCFLCSTNAITLDGKLVNTDGTGNRVSAMIFGPRQVIVVAGANKVVRDVDAALEKIEMFTAPQNNKRLNLPNPCTKSGVCMDCQNESRICNVTTIIRKKPSFTAITVLVVGEELGL